MTPFGEGHSPAAGAGRSRARPGERRQRPRRSWAIAALLLLTMASQSAAQAARRPAPGRWLPRAVRPIPGISAAQRAEAMETLAKIERILRQVPDLANPDGFEILPIISGGSTQVGPGFDGTTLPGSVVEYRLGLMHFAPSRVVAGEGSICIGVTVNPIQEGRLRDAEGRVVYIEPDRGTPSTNPNISDSRVPASAAMVYGELWNVPYERSIVDVLFVTAGELPWKPVSREAFYAAVLLEREGAGGEKMAELREGLTKTPYQVWMEGAAQRRKDHEQAMAQIRGMVPAARIEETRRIFETTEREVTDRLKQNEAGDRAQNRDARAQSFAMRDRMQAELARMTPEERRMPAYISKTSNLGPIATGWPLTADGAPPAWRVLTPNYDFWRARRSPVEVRSINVHLSITKTCLSARIQRALWQVYHTLDWAAINRLLDQPR